MVDLRAAYRSCVRDARGHYENFPVASALVPRDMRDHVAAVYAFARAADDFADEGERPAAERLRLLEAWRCRLRRAASGESAQAAAVPGEPANAAEIFTALSATMRDKALPRELFEDLLSAFAQDVTVTRYASWPELLDYCRRSANPVGRIVLRIAGYRDSRLDALSDDVCTALQLANFWQDLKIDFDRGRIYLPGEELRAHGSGEEDFSASRLTGGLHDALQAAVARTRLLFDRGRPICDAVRGRLGYELRATWLGGVRILDRLEAAAFDVLRRRPRLGARDVPWLAWNVVWWPAERRAR